jgi:hypothetical protein
MAEAEAPPGVPPAPAQPWWYLRALDREVLGFWLLSKLSLLVIAFSGPHLFAGDTGTNGRLERWQTWDFAHFDQIAIHGYFAPWRAPVEAFFPGLPLLMRGGLDVGIPTVVTGLIVSAIATAVAVVALARLAELEYGRAAARLSVVVWLAAPVAFFLTAPYTEAPFLAFAIPAWLAARKDRWLVACLLAAGACLFRVSALFLVAALGVQFLTTRDWRRPREIAIRLPLFLIPLVPLGAYMAYLHAHTGDWLSWYHAQEVGWYRQFTPPWTALEHTWQAVGGAMGFGAETTQGTIDEYAWMFAAEIVAVVIGLIATVALLVHRRWGEATWVGLQVVSLSTSYWFFSVPRTALLWWPMWMMLGAWAARRRWVLYGYLAVSLPLLGIWASAFLTYRWAG